MNHPVSPSDPPRSALVLTWASIVVFALGAGPILLFWLTAEWGQGGELDGMALIGGALITFAGLTVCSIAGLVLAIVARRRGAADPAWLLATSLNLMGIAAVVLLVLLNFLRARMVR